MVAEQAGPRGRTILLRNTVDGEEFSMAHRSQTVYHGPVVYSEDATAARAGTEAGHEVSSASTAVTAILF